MYHYTDGNLDNVWLANGYKIHETPYGEGISFTDPDSLTVAICLALAKKPSPLTKVEFRYLRSGGLLHSQAGLATLLGNNEQAVARWEKTGNIPPWADKLIRLLYLAHAEGDLPIASAVERINTIERAQKQRIVLRSAKSGWAAKLQPEPA
jgi:DNA-binding transcriptional regulator YiaG